MHQQGKRRGLRGALVLIGVLGLLASASSADARSPSAPAETCEWPPLICELFGLK